jgi:hypothetical protein
VTNWRARHDLSLAAHAFFVGLTVRLTARPDPAGQISISWTGFDPELTENVAEIIFARSARFSHQAKAVRGVKRAPCD